MNVEVKPTPAGGTLLAEPPEIARVGVVGAGQMGNGIAHVCALAGLPVTMLDVKPEPLKKAMATHRPQHGSPGQPQPDLVARTATRRWRGSRPAPITRRSTTRIS